MQEPWSAEAHECLELIGDQSPKRRRLRERVSECSLESLQINTDLEDDDDVGDDNDNDSEFDENDFDLTLDDSDDLDEAKKSKLPPKTSFSMLP
ncbi:hypothetical protein N9L68_01355 [bacterium]|nr:hypothetical protein [bacterium]